MTPQAPAEAHFAMSELEEILRSPNAAQTWVIVMHQLGELKDELNKTAKSGLSTKDYEVIDKTIKANATAAKLMLRFKPKDVS
jgi:hypothetical protein